MHHAGTVLAEEEALEQIKAGLPLGGRIIDVDSILDKLAAEPRSSMVHQIENAIVRWNGKAPNSRLPDRIRFRYCTFVQSGTDSLELVRSPSDAPLRWEFDNCFFETSITRFQNCVFDELRLDGVQTRGVLEFIDCTYARPPRLLRSAFFAEVRFDGVTCEDSWAVNIPGAWPFTVPGAWPFTRCQFHDDLLLSPPDRPTNIQFQHTTFTGNCQANIGLGPEVAEEISIRFDYCQIAGRVQVQPGAVSVGNRSTNRLAAGLASSSIRLYHTSIAGELDVSELALRSLGLEGCSIAGQIKIRPANLADPSDPLRITNFWRLNPVDRCGIAASEQRYRTESVARQSRLTEIRQQLLSTDRRLDRNALEADQNRIMIEETTELENIASEYGELRNSFSRVAGAIDSENFCHYKFKQYHREACRSRASILHAIRNSREPNQNHLHRPSRDTVARIGWFFDRWLWQVLLGYGVYARRPLATAIGLIGLFAFIYCICSELFENYGYITKDGLLLSGSAVPGGPTPPSPVGNFCAFGRALYFSVVTFTTLGYGDFHPEGVLQVFAALEALLGAVMIAFLTVVFARKFVR